MIADLQAKIEGVRARAQAKEAAAGVKGSRDGLAFLAGIKGVDRAMRVAGETGNDAMVRILEAARAPMAEHLVQMGLRLPDRKAGRPRKPRGKAKAGAA